MNPNCLRNSEPQFHAGIEQERKSRFLGWSVLMISMFTLPCVGQVLLDQSFAPPPDVVRLDTQVGIAPFRAGAQTFTPRLNGKLVGFDFWIQPLGGAPLTAQLQLEVQTTTAQGFPSGNSLGGVILPASFLGQQTGIYKYISLDGLNISLQAGQHYAAVFEAVPYVSGGNAAYDFRGYSISQLGGNYSYSGGQGMYTEDGATWRDYAGKDFDYVFKTYVAVPEPSVLVLLLCGGALFARVRTPSTTSPFSREDFETRPRASVADESVGRALNFSASTLESWHASFSVCRE